jgi:hypothetical protein
VTQPRFTPIESRDEVRAAKHLDPPRPWTAHRPAEHRPGAALGRSRIGTAGPDQGYALRLAEGVRDALVLGRGEHVDDAMAVATQVALRRAARFGRAPVRRDLESAMALLSFDGPVSAEVAALRSAAITGAAHDRWRCRAIAELVPDDALSVDPGLAASHAIAWPAVTAP